MNSSNISSHSSSTHPASAYIILAAGKGSRMRASMPKVLHPLGGRALLGHVLDKTLFDKDARVVVVAGHEAKQIEDYIAKRDDARISIAHQAKQMGTAHAVQSAMEKLADFSGNVIVLCGDAPFISENTLMRMKAAIKDADVFVAGFESENPYGYGRIVRSARGISAIIEEKDCTPIERNITLCSAGVFASKASILRDFLPQISAANAAGEYYLPDIVALGARAGLACDVLLCAPEEAMGINSQKDLAFAESQLQDRMRADALEKGVFMPAPHTVFLCADTAIAPGCVIDPYVVFGTGVSVGEKAHIRAFSHLEKCDIGEGAVIGPYARVRPESTIKDNARVGNFVEVKNSTLEKDVKANHLSYIGDSTIKAETNIGAGTVICNYDGVMKHHTEIGAGVFVGSNATLIAPVAIGDGALIGAGSVITRDVDKNSMAIARAPQHQKTGIVKRYFRRLKDAMMARNKQNSKQNNTNYEKKKV